MNPPEKSSHLVLTARTPDDIAAFVPVALGFVPHRSAVLVATGAAGMNARVDLPHDPDDVDDVVEALLRPARLHRLTEVVLIVYDDDTIVADEVAWALHEEFTAAGIRVHQVLRIHDDHWYAVLPGAPLEAYRGVRFDRQEHRFTAQGILDGRVTYASRDELKGTIAPDPDAAARTAAALRTAAPLPVGALHRLTRGHVEQRTTFSDDELASVALTVPTGARRDEAWAWLTRGDARRAVDLWSDAVRRLPTSHVAAPAAVLAFTAWLSGDGALAWCAVDRSREAEPGQSLADLVAHLLESATSPDTWAALRPRFDGTADPAA
jgi:hypothetical protein